MQQLIDIRGDKPKILDNPWRLEAEDLEISSAAGIAAHSLIAHKSLQQCSAEIRAELLGRDDIGLWLNSDDDPAILGRDCLSSAVIAVNFPLLGDGRGFSIGRILVEHYRYSGELRAVGAFMHDQLFYLRRCGFNSFCPDNQERLEEALKLLTGFAVGYQAAVDQSKPLYKLHKRPDFFDKDKPSKSKSD